MAYDLYLKKIILWMKTIHYPNKIRSHLITIVSMAPITPKSTSKLRSALHFRYSMVSHASFPIANTVCFKNPKLNPNNHYHRGFRNTFDYNHCMCSDYSLYTVTASDYIIC